MRTPLLLAAVGLLVTGCGSDRTDPAPPDAPAAAPTAPAARLEIVLDPGDGGEPSTWTLTCAPPGGTHPDPGGACADLAAAADPFAPPDPGEVCAQVFGGPQTAHVTGTWDAAAVEAHFARTDACATARWDAVGRLLPPVPPAAVELDPDAPGGA